MDEIERLMREATDTRRAYREACGVGVIGDSAASLVAMMNTDGPEFKAMRAATDALNRAAVNALPELLALREEVGRLRTRVGILDQMLDAAQPYALLGVAVSSEWPEIGEIDGFDLFTMMEKSGVIVQHPEPYDPARHGEIESVDPGDPFYTLAVPREFVRAALNQETKP